MKPTQNHNFQYITFRLARNLMGVDILDIREIVHFTKITKVHCAPRFVMGLMNLRGQILTILNIGVLLGIEKPGRTFGSHIIVFKHINVGFAVDQIGDMFDIDRDSVEPIPVNMDDRIQKYTDTIINLPDSIMLILNAGKILSCIRTEIQTDEDGL